MASLIRLDEYKNGKNGKPSPSAGPPSPLLVQKSGSRKITFFNRVELMALLNMYTRRVMTGEWRDYAIDHDRNQATFSVFRHAAEYPVFAITKIANDKGKGKFILRSGTKQLKRGHSVDEIIAALDKKLRLVWDQR